MSDWKGQQGDQLWLPVFIQSADGTEITSENCAKLRFSLGNATAYWPDGELRYANGAWRFPLTADASYSDSGEAVPYQAQAQFEDGMVLSSRVGTVSILPSALLPGWADALTEPEEWPEGKAPTVRGSGPRTLLLVTVGQRTGSDSEPYEGPYDVTPTKETQILPTDEKVADGDIVIQPIPSEYVVTEDATAKPENIYKGKTAWVKGVKITGTAEAYVVGKRLVLPEGLVTV